MAIVPNRPAALARRVATWSLGVDVAVGLIVGLFISSTIGFILFLIGLLITGVIYWNFRQVMRTKGMR
jgi:ABC-type dipeptide/oligopeptide/nickel transport system permease subunit